MFKQIALSFLFYTTAISASRTVYVGAYTSDLPWNEGTPSENILALTLDDSGNVQSRMECYAGVDPTFLTLSNSQNTLYVANEATGGDIYAFRVGAGGGLTDLNTVSSGGDNAVHLLVAPEDDYLFVAHYAGGSVSVMSLDPATGEIGELLDTVVFTGEGSKIVEYRQDGAFAHGVTLKGKYLFVPDLGNDVVMQLVWDAEAGTLELNPLGNEYRTKEGSGPRHMIFVGEYGYLVNELDNTLEVVSMDEATGLLEQVGILDILETTPADQKASAIHYHGGYLYVSNRGTDNSISQFEIGSDGMVTRLSKVDTEGSMPRDFGFLHPGMMLVGNQDSDEIQAFNIDADGAPSLVNDYSPIEYGLPTAFAVLTEEHDGAAQGVSCRRRRLRSVENDDRIE